MDNRSGSDPASSPSTSVAVRRRRDSEEDGGDPAAACTGRSCESCTAGVIADCVAVCCCPCGVVNILALAFLKLPWAVARKCIGGRKRRIRRRGTAEGGGDSGILEMSSSIGGAAAMVIEDFSAEDIWIELTRLGIWVSGGFLSQDSRLFTTGAIKMLGRNIYSHLFILRRLPLVQGGG